MKVVKEQPQTVRGYRSGKIRAKVDKLDELKDIHS